MLEQGEMVYTQTGKGGESGYVERGRTLDPSSHDRVLR